MGAAMKTLSRAASCLTSQQPHPRPIIIFFMPFLTVSCRYWGCSAATEAHELCWQFPLKKSIFFSTKREGKSKRQSMYEPDMGNLRIHGWNRMLPFGMNENGFWLFPALLLLLFAFSESTRCIRMSNVSYLSACIMIVLVTIRKNQFQSFKNLGSNKKMKTLVSGFSKQFRNLKFSVPF